ncbi:MAG: GNAT family N-acetyltransferase [Ideonella sp.]|nr:GNAT family N-acetyltransferase [Ideonella sp.]
MTSRPAAASPAWLARIEDACLNASAPPQQRWLDGWLMRLSPGKARRARSVHALFDGHLPLDERLADAETVYRAAGLPLIFRITPFTQPAGLDGELDRRGFVRVDETLVLYCPVLPEHADTLPDGLTLESPCHVDFADAVGELRASPPAHRRSHAERLVLSPVPYQGWLVRRPTDGAIVACAQTVRDGDMVGLYDVFVHPAARGQALSRRLCAKLLAQARGNGARLGYLQVQADNAPAVSVYRRLGFVDGYRYHYRGRAGQTD